MIKRLINRVFYGYRCDSDTYLNHLRRLGAKIGSDVTIFASKKTSIDILNPL